MSDVDRRSFIGTILTLATAPAIIRSGVLMPIMAERKIILPRSSTVWVNSWCSPNTPGYGITVFPTLAAAVAAAVSETETILVAPNHIETINGSVTLGRPDRPRLSICLCGTESGQIGVEPGKSHE